MSVVIWGAENFTSFEVILAVQTQLYPEISQMTFLVYGSSLHVSVNSQQSCLIQGTLFTVRDTGCAETIVATRRRIRGSAEYQANFTHAYRLECLDKNPMTLVRQGAKRQKAPDVLELDGLKMLLGELDNPARLLAFRTAAKFKRR